MQMNLNLDFFPSEASLAIRGYVELGSGLQSMFQDVGLKGHPQIIWACGSLVQVFGLGVGQLPNCSSW
jgi:hypothetical protein